MFLSLKAMWSPFWSQIVPYGLNCSPLSLLCESSHRPYINEWMGLHDNRTSKTDGLIFLTPDLVAQIKGA